MPVCAGRPDTGRCPSNKVDSSVTWSSCDLFLCQECYDYRIPSAPVSDNRSKPVSTEATAMASASTSATSADVRNELLCFVQQKSTVMTVDHLVKLSSDFYRNDEIVAARNIVNKFIQHRLSKRQGADSARKSMEDIVKLCLDPNVHLPAFYATDLSRLPPVDATHCDVSALLIEIQSLRAEVREIAQLKTELEQLKAEVKVLTQSRHDADNRVPNNANQWPRLSENQAVAVDQSAPVKMTFANVAENLAHSANTGEKPFNLKRNNRPARRSQLICGKATNQTMIAVDGLRRANIFLTRLNPDTTTTDIETLIKNVVPKCSSVKAEKQQTRFDTYSSFSAEICVSRSNFEELIGSVYSADTWPAGILVRRFYRIRNGAK